MDKCYSLFICLFRDYDLVCNLLMISVRVKVFELKKKEKEKERVLRLI